MPLPKDFWQQLPIKTDAELSDMLAHQDDYLAEALAAAKAELIKRNVTPERLAQIEAWNQPAKPVTDAKAKERLSWNLRIIIFCFGPLLGIVLAVYYDNKGYKGKASDCWKTMGVMASIALATLIVLGILVLF